MAHKVGPTDSYYYTEGPPALASKQAEEKPIATRSTWQPKQVRMAKRKRKD